MIEGSGSIYLWLMDPDADPGGPKTWIPSIRIRNIAFKDKMADLVSQIMSLWSSPTLPKRDSWSRCQATSSTTAVWPVNIVFALMILFSCRTNNKNSDPQPALIWENMDEDLKKAKITKKKLCGRSLHRTGDISWKFCANDKQLVKSKFSWLPVYF